LEQEHDRHADVILSRQTESFPSQNVPVTDRNPVIQRRKATKIRHTNVANAAELDTETDQEVTDHADRIDEEIHRHDMQRVFPPAEAGFNEREAKLHEHDEEASEKRPGEIDPEAVLANERRELRRKRFTRRRLINSCLIDRAGRDPDNT
jgi:hypothetical protein